MHADFSPVRFPDRVVDAAGGDALVKSNVDG